MIINKNNKVQRGENAEPVSHWETVNIKPLLDYFSKENRVSGEEVNVGKYRVFMPAMLNYKDTLEQSKRTLANDQTPIWVSDQSKYDIQLIYSLENATIGVVEKDSSLYTYLASECKTPYIAIFYGEYVRFCKISVLDYKACHVALQGIIMLPSDFVYFIENGILPGSKEALEFTNSSKYYETYIDFVTDIAKYQYRAGIISKLNKRSASNIVKMLGRYVIVDGSRFKKAKPRKGESWFDRYLDNAQTFSNPEYAEGVLSNIKYGNPEVKQVTLSMVDSELHYQKYLIRGYV